MRNLYETRVFLVATLMGLAAPASIMAGNGDNGTVTGVQVFYESFNGLEGSGGNDGYFDNDDDAGIEIATEDLETADLLDNKEGWGDFTKVAICDKCVRLATKKNNGEITTPAFSLDGSDGVLTFNAAAQLGDAVTMYVETVDGGQLTYNGTTGTKIAIDLPETVAGETVLANERYTMSISGVETSCRLKFSSVSTSDSKQRFFLDEIKVEKSIPSGIVSVETDKPKSHSEIYTIAGQRVNAGSANTLSKGIYIIDGKKTIVK